MATGKKNKKDSPVEYLYKWYVYKDYDQDGPTEVQSTIKRAKGLWPEWEPLFNTITIIND